MNLAAIGTVVPDYCAFKDAQQHLIMFHRQRTKGSVGTDVDQPRNLAKSVTVE